MNTRVPLEFSGLGAGEIKRHPEVETLPITRDNHIEVMRKVLSWLGGEVNQGPHHSTFRDNVRLMIALQNGMEFRKLTPSLH